MAKKKKSKVKVSTSKIKKKKKWVLVKQKPPARKPKKTEEDEIDLEVIPELEVDGLVSDDSQDGLEGPEVESVIDAADPLETMEDSETFSLGGSEDDGRLETVRSNPKPKLGWADKTKPIFSPGDLVVPIELSKKEALEFEPYKIVCPHVYVESYCIKKSRILVESIIYSDEVQLAPKNGKPFVTHWEANDPFKVPGLNISCPSNNKK